MEFRTQLNFPPSDSKIDYHSPILGIGSCFIEHIGGLLQQSKFPVLLNPFGIVYNPFSINSCLQRLLQNKLYTEKELVENRGIWYSFDHHGRMSSPDPGVALTLINQSYKAAIQRLEDTKWLFLTFGTATTYLHTTSNKIVANCHKFPNHLFGKERLSIGKIVDTLSPTLSELTKINKDLNILLTVSPIRHVKDGIIESQRSKATLLLATEQLTTNFKNVHYFPAYELVMDDLRDYRFYERDLVHPNQIAVDYIWEAFINAYFSTETKQLQTTIKKIVQASNHRPFHPNSAQYQQFCQQQLVKIAQLEKAHPTISFEKEKSYFKSAN